MCNNSRATPFSSRLIWTIDARSDSWIIMTLLYVYYNAPGYHIRIT
jgi:hypothetical protein